VVIPYYLGALLFALLVILWMRYTDG